MAAEWSPVKEDLNRYRLRARLQAEALIWVQLVPVVAEPRVIGPDVKTQASTKRLFYWSERFAPLINNPGKKKTLAQFEEVARSKDWLKSWEGSHDAARTRNSIAFSTTPRFLAAMRNDFQKEVDQLRSLFPKTTKRPA